MRVGSMNGMSHRTLFVGSLEEWDISRIILHLQPFKMIEKSDFKHLHYDSKCLISCWTFFLLWFLVFFPKILGRNIITLSLHDADKLVHAFIASRLDYCNSLPSGCSNKNLNKLQRVQNTAAWALNRTRKFDQISPIFSRLNGLGPKYLCAFISCYSCSHVISARLL